MRGGFLQIGVGRRGAVVITIISTIVAIFVNINVLTYLPSIISSVIYFAFIMFFELPEPNIR